MVRLNTFVRIIHQMVYADTKNLQINFFQFLPQISIENAVSKVEEKCIIDDYFSYLYKAIIYLSFLL